MNKMAKIPKSDQVGNTNQRNKWANTDPRIYRRWDQVPRRSKHPLLSPVPCTILLHVSNMLVKKSNTSSHS
jgi:hypothetical protein